MIRTTLSDDLLPVVIIGGGLAGLTAALHLAERGVPAVVLEADASGLGGRMSGGEPDTFEYQGKTWAFTPEHGVHALWGGYVNMLAMLERFSLATLQTSPGEEWINRWGREVRYIEAGNAIRSRWIPAPFHYLQLLLNPTIWANIIPLDFLSLPGFLASVLLTVGLDPLQEQRALDGLRLRDFFLGWTPNLKATFTGLATNLLAAPQEEIDLAAYIAALRFYTLLRRDSWQMRYLPDNAYTALIQPMQKAICARDGLIRPGVTAVQLQHMEGGWRIVVDDAAKGGRRSLRAQQVILALDAPGAKRLLCESADTAAEAEKIIFPEGLRNTVVRLWFSKAPRPGTPGGMLTGDFVPDNFFWLHRLYPDCCAWHEQTGGSIAELHFYGKGDALDQPEKNLLILATSEIQKAFPEVRGAFIYGAVRSNSKVQTRFRIPTAESLFVKTPWENIHACGDWIGYDTPSLWMERSVTTALAAANAVLAAYGHEPYPILQPPPPEIFVRALSALVRGGRWLAGRPVMALWRGIKRLRGKQK